MTEYCHHIGLYTQRPERLIEFYTTKLGFEETDSKTIGRELMEEVFGLPSSCRLTKLKRGRSLIEIFHSPSVILEKSSRKAEGLNHWGLCVESKKDFVCMLEKRGVQPTVIKGSGKDIVFISDPDGNLIEIYEDKDLP